MFTAIPWLKIIIGAGLVFAVIWLIVLMILAHEERRAK